MKKKVKAAEKFQTIGVRFSTGLRQIYSYRVKAKKKIYLGQELVVRNQFGTTTVYVVALNYVGEYSGPLKELTEKVSRL